MSDEQQASAKKGPSKKTLLLGLVTIAVAAVLILASIILLGSGSEEDGPVTGSMSDLILQPRDMGSEWQVHIGFANSTYDMQPGAYQMGEITLKRDNGSADGLYILKVSLIFYESTEGATLDFENISEDIATDLALDYPNPKAVDVGDDDAWVYDIDRLATGLDGKSAFFRERNVICIIQYGAGLPGMVTESMVIDVANMQIDKL